MDISHHKAHKEPLQQTMEEILGEALRVLLWFFVIILPLVIVFVAIEWLESFGIRGSFITILRILESFIFLCDIILIFMFVGIQTAKHIDSMLTHLRQPEESGEDLEREISRALNNTLSNTASAELNTNSNNATLDPIKRTALPKASFRGYRNAILLLMIGFAAVLVTVELPFSTPVYNLLNDVRHRILQALAPPESQSRISPRPQVQPDSEAAKQEEPHKVTKESERVEPAPSQPIQESRATPPADTPVTKESERAEPAPSQPIQESRAVPPPNASTPAPNGPHANPAPTLLDEAKATPQMMANSYGLTRPGQRFRIKYNCKTGKEMGVDFVICPDYSLRELEAKLEVVYKKASISINDLEANKRLRIEHKNWQDSFGPNCGLPNHTWGNQHLKPTDDAIAQAHDCVRNKLIEQINSDVNVIRSHIHPRMLPE